MHGWHMHEICVNAQIPETLPWLLRLVRKQDLEAYGAGEGMIQSPPPHPHPSHFAIWENTLCPGRFVNLFISALLDSWTTITSPCHYQPNSPVCHTFIRPPDATPLPACGVPSKNPSCSPIATRKVFNQCPREHRWNLNNRCFYKCAMALKGKCKVLVFTPKHSIMFYGTGA